jgi:hypothetical protein
MCQPSSTIASTVVRKPRETVPLSPASYSPNLFKPHVSLKHILRGSTVRFSSRRTDSSRCIASWLSSHSRPVSYVVCFLLSLPSQPLLPLLVPPLALQTPRCTATPLDSLADPPASVPSVLLGSPVMSISRLLGPAFPVVVPRCLACLVLPTRSAMVRLPFLVCMSLPPLSLLPMLLLPRLPTVMMKIPFRVSPTVLLWFHVMVMLRFLSCTPVVLAVPPRPPLLLLALSLPCRLAAAANALSGG